MKSLPANITPQHPRQLFPGRPVAEYLTVGEDPRAEPQAGSAALELRVWNADTSQVSAAINGQALALQAGEGDSVTAAVEPDGIVPGANRIEVTLDAAAPRPALLADARILLA